MTRLPQYGELLHDRYRILDRIGGGGYADVFRAKALAGGVEEVAVKALRNRYHVNTFEREAVALEATSGCPSIPAFVDAFDDETGLYIVTAFEPGARLDRRIAREGALSDDLIGRFLEQMLACLRCVHERGFLHKDLKPSNVLVAGDRFSLLDWGVAERLGAELRCESIRANQNYVAPENFHGRHGVASDFYALGCSLYQLAHGRLPYRLDTIRAKAYRPYAHCLEPARVGAAIDGHLAVLIRGLLCKDPERRPLAYSVDELAAAARETLRTAADGPSGEHEAAAAPDDDAAWEALAARQGIPYSQYRHAQRLEADARPGEAADWYARASAAGYLSARVRLARLLQRDGEAGRALALYREAAEAGNAAAANVVGFRFLNGDGLPKDVDQAQYWLEGAARSGHAAAQNNLGLLHERERRDDRQALYWYTEAARRGNCRAQNNVARCYELGLGTAAERAKAVYWYAESAALGDRKAARRLAQLTTGDGGA